MHRPGADPGFQVKGWLDGIDRQYRQYFIDTNAITIIGKGPL
jgi:hypothetical protein